jgi:hypothetical protein
MVPGARPPQALVGRPLREDRHERDFDRRVRAGKFVAATPEDAEHC